MSVFKKSKLSLDSSRLEALKKKEKKKEKSENGIVGKEALRDPRGS